MCVFVFASLCVWGFGCLCVFVFVCLRGCEFVGSFVFSCFVCLRVCEIMWLCVCVSVALWIRVFVFVYLSIRVFELLIQTILTYSLIFFLTILTYHTYVWDLQMYVRMERKHSTYEVLKAQFRRIRYESGDNLVGG